MPKVPIRSTTSCSLAISKDQPRPAQCLKKRFMQRLCILRHKRLGRRLSGDWVSMYVKSDGTVDWFARVCFRPKMKGGVIVRMDYCNSINFCERLRAPAAASVLFMALVQACHQRRWRRWRALRLVAGS